MEQFEVFCHSSILLKGSKKIYIDPFNIPNSFHDADFIFITHSHWDHFSLIDILKVRKEDTIYVVTKELFEELLDIGISEECILIVKPYENYHFTHLNFQTIPAYNLKKDYHPKEKGWVGYLIELDNTKYYIAGDTDVTIENKKVIADVVFLPVGGTYTMDYKEASKLANTMMPEKAIPTHYGKVIGSNEDASLFCKLLNPEIKGLICYHEQEEKNDGK